MAAREATTALRRTVVDMLAREIDALVAYINDRNDRTDAHINRNEELLGELRQRELLQIQMYCTDQRRYVELCALLARDLNWNEWLWRVPGDR